MKNCESFWRLTRRDEEAGFPLRLRSNEVRQQKGRNLKGRLQFTTGEAANSKLKNPGDFSFVNISTVSYPITRAIQNGEPLVEWALCRSCGDRIREGISEASKKAIEGFLADVGLSPDHFKRSVEEKITYCFLCHRPRSDFSGYTITAVCSGREHINFDTPRLICHDCEAKAGELLSDETLDYWDDFIEQHFGPPPGSENTVPKARPALI